MWQWFFVYDTLLDYTVQYALFKRKPTVYSYTMQFVETCVGLDGFKYIVDNFECSVDGLILELTPEEQDLVGLWLGSMYKKKFMYVTDLDRVLVYYTYETIPDLTKRKFMTMQGKLGSMSTEDIQQLAIDFREYIDNVKSGVGVTLSE